MNKKNVLRKGGVLSLFASLFAFFLAGYQVNNALAADTKDITEDLASIQESHLDEIVDFEPTVSWLENLPREEWSLALCRNERMIKEVIIPVSEEFAKDLSAQGYQSAMLVLAGFMTPDMACTAIFAGIAGAEEALEKYNSLLDNSDELERELDDIATNHFGF